MKHAGKHSMAPGAALILACALSTGCPADPRTQDPHQVVAKVGQAEISRDFFLAELLRMGVPRTADKSARQKVARRILDRMVEEELLLRAAVKANVQVPEEDVVRASQHQQDGYPSGYFRRVLHAEQITPAELKERLGRQLRIDAYLKARLSSLPAPTEAEAKALFDKEGKVAQLPAQVRVRQILVETEEEAKFIKEQIKQKKLRMDEASARFSKAPESRKGGDLGWFAKGELPEVFDVCFDLELGTLSDVVSSPYGFHLFEVTDKRPARQESFALAKDRLMADLRLAHEKKAVQTVLTELRNQTPIHIDAEALADAVSRMPDPPKEPQAPGAAPKAPPQPGGNP